MFGGGGEVLLVDVAERHDVAAGILRTYARFVDQGMLPNRFPDKGEAPEYNTVDATLWYFIALYEYWRATGDTSLVGELFPALSGIVAWHRRGTRYDIHVDEADGLLHAGEPGAGLETLGKVWTGVGPFTHSDPRDRPPAVFGGDVTLHTGPDRRAHVLLPVIPEK